MGDDVGPTEVVRRGLALLSLYVGLDDHEELAVRDRRSGKVQCLRLVWDLSG